MDLQEYITRGIELMSQEKYAEARQVFTQASQVDRRNEEVYLHLGNACVSDDDLDAGIAAYKRALLANPESTEALYSLGCAYFMKNDYANALKHFNKVEAQGNATVDMYEIMVSMFVDSNDMDMALRSINRAIQAEPLNASLRVTKSELYVMQGKTKEAVATMRELQEIMPDEGVAYGLEAEILLGAEDEEGALAALDRALQRFPQDPSLYAVKARALNNLGRYEEALSCAVRAKDMPAEDDSVVQDLTLQHGIALGGLNRVEESIQVLEKAAGNDVNAVMAYYTLMNECMLVKQYAKTEWYAHRILGMDEGVEERIRASAEFFLALAVQRQGRDEEARQLYQKVTRDLRRMNILNPGLFEGYAYRVIAHRELGEYEKAIDLCDHLIALDGGSASTLALKYEVLVAKGDAAEAAKLRARVLELDPTYRFGSDNE